MHIYIYIYTHANTLLCIYCVYKMIHLFHPFLRHAVLMAARLFNGQAEGGSVDLDEALEITGLLEIRNLSGEVDDYVSEMS